MRLIPVTRRITSRWLTVLLLAGLSVVFLFPFYWLAVSAFRNQAEIFTMPPMLWLSHLRLENFIALYKETNICRAFFNSVVIAVGSVGLSLFLCSLIGYAFAKFPSAPGADKLFVIVLGTMMIPGAVTMIPTFIILTKLHMINTYWSMIVPGAANAFGIFWMRQYIASHVPDDLCAAARIDGCSEFGIYWRIVLPIIQPATRRSGNNAADRLLEQPYGRLPVSTNLQYADSSASRLPPPRRDKNALRHGYGWRIDYHTPTRDRFPAVSKAFHSGHDSRIHQTVICWKNGVRALLFTNQPIQIHTIWLPYIRRIR